MFSSKKKKKKKKKKIKPLGLFMKKKKIKPLGLFMGGPRQNPKARGPPRLGKKITADRVVKE